MSGNDLTLIYDLGNMADSSINMDELRRRFTSDMLRGADELSRLRYDAKLFVRMISDHGAVEAARRLILAQDFSSGLWRLQTMGKLQMSVEMWVLLPWYEPLFDQAIRDQAERKLQLLLVDVRTELHQLINSFSADGE